MNVLLFGADCGTHALAWKIFNSPLVDELICSPGNGGTDLFTPGASVASDDLAEFARFALGEAVDLVVADAPGIAAGVADEADALHIHVFGSGKAAAALLRSRVRQHEWLLAHNLPVPLGRAFERPEQAEKYAAALPLPIAVRSDAPDGPSIVCLQRGELRSAIEYCLQGQATDSGGKVLVHEWQPGPLAAVSALVGATHSYPIPPVRLHQLAGDPWSPVVGAHRATTSVWTRLADRLEQDIRAPLIAGFRQDDLPIRGWIGADCRLAANGPVVESLRLTPEPLEAALLLPQLDRDLVPLLQALADGQALGALAPTWGDEAAVAVRLVASGWPKSFATGQTIEGLADVDPGVRVFHDSTASPLALSYTPKAGRLTARSGSIWDVLAGNRSLGPGSALSATKTAGGEVLAVVAHAPFLSAARDKAYTNLRRITVASTTYLPDVGEREL